jgi:hypothetical protein
MPAAAAAIDVAIAEASQRLLTRKPRSSAKRFCSMYSGMKRWEP